MGNETGNFVRYEQMTGETSRELAVPLYHSAMTINVIEEAHAANPLNVKY